MTQRRIYQCARPYHISFNILNHEGFFEDAEKAELLHEVILNAGDIKNHTVYQFCIMLDHVHVLCKTNPAIGGFCPRTLENMLCQKPAECDCRMEHEFNISDFIKSIKGTFSWKIHIGKLWQKRFRDEIVHSDNQLYKTIKYIIDNPVKAELPEKWHKHPYQYKNNNLIEKLFR